MELNRMPRQKAKLPKYHYHVSGQARVYLDGRYFYLGTYDSPESHARYFALCKEYQKDGCKMHEDSSTHPSEDAPITVSCVTADYLEFAKVKYAKSPGDYSKHESLCDLLDYEYGDLPAVEFGPRRLSEIRDLLVATKNRRGRHNTRHYINQQVQIIVQVFKRAVARELVPVEVWTALKALDSLREGETVANESTDREPVGIESVRLTAEHLSPVLKTMVRIQAATGMRPSEVLRMRPIDIDKRADGVWVYRPNEHKTKRHGKKKQVPIVGDAQVALEPYLDREPTEYCFKPEESARWYQEQKSAKRKTPANQGDRPGYNKRTRAGESKPRQYSPKFDKDSYRRAIVRAAKKAGAEHWTPYQLRHTAATVIREALGIEGAQALPGHSKRQMTEHYAKESLDKAIEAAKAGPKI
ncbi:tyrosine-type recombinase/integrase [Rhodopirellula bahusiensis]|uniref:tyrosine-type recombinase/integrase n=1 Tax=Rhodopirellula bahusiensis TaxID=2014065 RepID=UPI0032982058